MNDNEIIRQLKNRDEDGLKQLMAQYTNYVTAILCNISQELLRVEDIEELAADVFLSIWNHSDGLLPDRPLKPYLAQVTRNAAISRLRRIKEAPLAFDEEIVTPGSGSSPDELTIRREQSEIIKQAVDGFCEPDREIFIRFYFLGEHIDAISRRLTLNPATTKTKLHRCRKRLRSIFQERGYQYE